MKYLVSTDPAVLMQLSTALWDAVRPCCVRQAGDISVMMGELVTHPTTGQWALEITDMTYAFDAASDCKCLDAILALLGVPLEDIQATSDLLAAMAGRCTSPEMLLPASLMVQALTYEQMQTDGWFQETDVQPDG